MFSVEGRTHSTLREHGLSALTPSTSPRKVTKDDDNNLPDGACRALWVGSDGTANLVFADETEATDFPLFKGMNQIACLRVKTGGTADDIWALY